MRSRSESRTVALFQPGQSGNPAGRPKGARSKLTETFLRALVEDFDTHGKVAIEACRAERPGEYLRICAMLIPKSLVGETVPIDLGDTDTAAGLVSAMARVLSAVESGSLSIEQAKSLSDILEAQRRAIETTELEARLRHLEAQAGIAAKPGAAPQPSSFNGAPTQ